MDSGYLTQMHQLLIQATANDTNQVKAATAHLNKEFFNDGRCIPALVEIIASSPQIAVRQLAAVELRKRISTAATTVGEMWLSVPQNERDVIKAKLPEITLKEENKLVRHSSARVISAIASIEIPTGTWPELLPLLNQCCSSPQMSTREVGVYVLFTVLENVVESFQEHLQSFFKLFERLVQDPESLEVRVTSVKALGIIAQYIEADEKPDIKTFQAFLPSMVQVLGQCIEAADEPNARSLFDVFETLLILETPLLGRFVPDLVNFFLQCGANKSFTEELRVMSLNALGWTVKYKKSKIQSAGLGAAMLQSLMPITTETEPDDLDDDAPSRSALRIIDNLSTSLPPSQIFPTLREQILQYMSSANPNDRRGAMLALGVSVEGCSEYMTPLMGQVWPVVEAGLKDPDQSVRRATCICVGCLCEWVDEECAAQHAALVPAIMQLVDNPETQKAACTALDGLLEILHDVIDLYMALIMERLTGLLDTAPLKVKAVVTGAIGSAAHASKQNFLPYFLPTMEKLKHFLFLTNDGEEIELRGITMDAIGTFAEAVGKEVFRPYFQDMMTHAFDAIQVDNARLRETSFLFFGIMARVYGMEFVPFLPQVVPKLVESMKQEEKGDFFLSLNDKALVNNGTTPATAISVEDPRTTAVEVDIEDLDDDDKMLEVNSAIAVEKEIAADTIGMICQYTGSSFLPYVETCTLQLIELLEHYYEGIRKSALDSLLQILQSFYTLSDPPKWTPGLPNQGEITIHKNVSDLIGHVVPPLMEMYISEDDKTVVATLCSDLADTVKLIGPEFLRDNYESVARIATDVLEQKAACQQDPDQDEDDQPLDDQAEYDSVLVSSAGDLVAALAAALGKDFQKVFGNFFPSIAKYYKKGRSLSDRSSAIGCLAEIIAGMKSGVTPFTEQLYKIITAAIKDEDVEVRSNAAYALGMLVEQSELDMSSQYPDILRMLYPFFAANNANGAGSSANGETSAVLAQGKGSARDNAAGAVSRMIVRSAASLPLDQILPVLMSILPLKDDFLENGPLFRAIFHLFRTQPNVLTPYLNDGSLLRVFKFVLDAKEVEHIDMINEDTRTELKQLITILFQQDAGTIQAAGLANYVVN